MLQLITPCLPSRTLCLLSSHRPPQSFLLLPTRLSERPILTALNTLPLFQISPSHSLCLGTIPISKQTSAAEKQNPKPKPDFPNLQCNPFPWPHLHSSCHPTALLSSRPHIPKPNLNKAVPIISPSVLLQVAPMWLPTLLLLCNCTWLKLYLAVSPLISTLLNPMDRF